MRISEIMLKALLAAYITGPMGADLGQTRLGLLY